MKKPNIPPTWDEEHRLRSIGYHLIAGIDEVGRGTLAGPVMAAAVILDPDTEAPCYDDLRDSKTLTPRQRERLAVLISESAVGIGIGVAEHSEIDALGIVKATRLAMTRAVAHLPLPPHHLLIDAVPLPESGLPFKAIIRGDARCRSIAAASIVAKVARDQRMTREEVAHPGYGFARNRGYATLEHLRSLQRLGPSPTHRHSFAPVRALLEPASTAPPSPRQTRGRIGERAAADLLRERGFRLLDRNVRYTWGELDLVAEDGQTVVFVEVRARKGNNLGSPMESVTRAKQQRLVLAAQEYLQRNGLEQRLWRIDLIGVHLATGNRVASMEHLQNAVSDF